MQKFKSINLAELARRMGKSRQWLYQRLNRNLVNGKPARFTPEERALFLEKIGIWAEELGAEIEAWKNENP